MEKSTSNAARSRGSSFTNNGLSDKIENVKDAASEKLSAVYSDYPEIEEIQKDWGALRSDVARLTSHATRDTREAASHFTGDIMKKIERQVHDKPGQTVAFAFLGGIVASFLLGRRR